MEIICTSCSKPITKEQFMIALEESGTYFFCRESKEFIDASDIIKNPEYWHEKCWKKSDKCSLKDV